MYWRARHRAQSPCAPRRPAEIGIGEIEHQPDAAAPDLAGS
jgi:hypothetical protein